MGARVEKTLVLSTGHLCLATREKLEKKQINLSMLSWDWGWVIWTYGDDDRSEHDDPIPADLWQAFDLARREGCTWVRFDCDADRHGNMEWFEDEEHHLITAVRLARMAEARKEKAHARAA